MKIWINKNGNPDHKRVLLEVIGERIPVEEAADGLQISLVIDKFTSLVWFIRIEFFRIIRIINGIVFPVGPEFRHSFSCHVYSPSFYLSGSASLSLNL